MHHSKRFLIYYLLSNVKHLASCTKLLARTFMTAKVTMENCQNTRAQIAEGLLKTIDEQSTVQSAISEIKIAEQLALTHEIAAFTTVCIHAACKAFKTLLFHQIGFDLLGIQLCLFVIKVLENVVVHFTVLCRKLSQ